MRASVVLLLLLAGCTTSSPPPPTVTAVDTFCTRVDRYHATDAQKAAFRRDQATWESLVNWLSGINEQWDRNCR